VHPVRTDRRILPLVERNPIPRSALVAGHGRSGQRSRSGDQSPRGVRLTNGARTENHKVEAPAEPSEQEL
jgi:hypothetical protein